MERRAFPCYNSPRKRKEENKRALRAELSLPDGSDIPMLSVISRLVAAKGMDLFFEAAGRMLADGRTQLVVLGTGERRYEDFFRGLEARYPGQVRALIRYDRKLAKRIYAASDIFLMPSAIEACGLSQMIASRYGAIPVVHETGGLFDSIKGCWEENGEMHVEEILDVVDLSISQLNSLLTRMETAGLINKTKHNYWSV